MFEDNIVSDQSAAFTLVRLSLPVLIIIDLEPLAISSSTYLNLVLICVLLVYLLCNMLKGLANVLTISG